MARYIDAEALKNTLTHLEPVGYATSVLGKVTLKTIDKEPTADVVEVVRCKDCKYWVEVKDLGMFCTHWGSPLAESKADDFCSYGERKGGEGDG